MIQEDLIYSDYSIWTKRRSKIDPTEILRVEIGLTCPHCKTSLPSLDHGEKDICPCGLRMKRTGNNLRCSKMEDTPKNINVPPIKVQHADLKRASEASLYKSECPVCPDGILLVYRNQETGELLDHDRCISCGQQFAYLDIEGMRVKENK